jgi:uncharacterized membrane protein
MDLRTALAWACVPLVASVLLTAPALALFGRDLFTSSGPSLGSWSIASAYYGLAALNVVLAAWSIVAVVLALAEAQRFAWWRAIANYLLAVAAVMAPIFGVAYYFMGA